MQATPAQRYIAAKALLDQLRKELVIDAELLQPENLDKLKREVGQALNENWTIETHELLHEATWATLASGSQNRRAKVKLTINSKIGRFLRSNRVWSWLNLSLPEPDYDRLIESLVNALTDSGYLIKDAKEVQLRSNCLIWTTQKVSSIAADILTSKRLQGFILSGYLIRAQTWAVR